MRTLHAIIQYVNQTCDRYRWSVAELILEAPIAIIPVLASVIEGEVIRLLSTAIVTVTVVTASHHQQEVCNH